MVVMFQEVRDEGLRIREPLIWGGGVEIIDGRGRWNCEGIEEDSRGLKMENGVK